ncbi:hypothetical protein Q3G72_030571 [Acer saccharum]|nr:hypothetical protein Q3G72_030571 [Acer saccharum]
MKLMIQIQCKFLKERNDGTSTANKVPRAKTTFKEIKMLEFTPKANIDHFMKEKWKFRKEFQSGGLVDMVLLLLPRAVDNLWNTKGSGNFPGPKHKMLCQNHLGYDLNFKAPTDEILVASAALSSLMFAVCIQIDLELPT